MGVHAGILTFRIGKHKSSLSARLETLLERVQVIGVCFRVHFTASWRPLKQKISFSGAYCRNGVDFKKAFSPYSNTIKLFTVFDFCIISVCTMVFVQVC